MMKFMLPGMNVWAWLQQEAAQPQEQLNPLEKIWAYLTTQIQLGSIRFSAVSIVMGFAVIFVAVAASRALQGYLERRIAARGNIDPGVRYTIFRLAHYIIIILGLMYALKAAFGLDFTSLAVVFTALSVGIGFGLQYIAGDIASGFILLFERPVRIGDFISVGDTARGNVEGRVQNINLRTTEIITNDGLAIVVPNSKLVQNSLVNWTYPDRKARIGVPIGVAYGSDVDLVTKTLLRAAEGVSFVLDDPKPSVQFKEFADFSLNFRLLVWISKPRRHPAVQSQINYNIQRLFNEAGIEIPFPRRDVFVHGVKPDSDGLEFDEGDTADFAADEGERQN